MKMSEYIRGEWKKMKGQPLKVRLAYFWDYYKWPTIVVLLIVVALTYTAAQQLSRKEDAVCGILIDSMMPIDEPELLQDFCDEVGINTKKQKINLVTGLSIKSIDPSMGYMSYQRILAGIAAQETDFLIADADAMQQCGYDSTYLLMDLRNFLSPEQLTALEDSLYYIDGKFLEDDIVVEEETVTYPSPLAPEEMDSPIPVGIDIHDCTELLDSYYSTNQPLYFAVVINAPHLDRTTQFFEYILEHTDKT